MQPYAAWTLHVNPEVNTTSNIDSDSWSPLSSYWTVSVVNYLMRLNVVVVRRSSIATLSSLVHIWRTSVYHICSPVNDVSP